MKSFAAKILGMVPWGRANAKAVEVSKGLEPAPAAQATPMPAITGTEPGWLRVLSAEQLLATVKAGRALEAIWRQSRQATQLWERDLLPAIHRYAEFVQLMPASEAHHHAHAGGLLSHTLEMLVAAMTWRNAYLLPGGSQIEEIDAQRDQWSYVVFYCTLLHDIAKPMTDLRIAWRCDGMADSIRWSATGGSLAQITAGRPAPEYLVDFAPKSQRDYGAHARLAQLLLPRIAPETALKFLAHTPEALDALDKYLCGQDRDSLVAQIVRRADKRSTEQALKSGPKGRFPTSKAVPLIDLMMQAVTSMLQAGTELPLNRSGGAAWVYDGAIWFVAKRLADAVREWIKKHEPDEAVPGDSKNDRLFDTWQDYGVLELNPLTGQAIWHVTVHGHAAEQGAPGSYTHDLAMLKFPLAKVFAHESKYPAPMQGRLEVREKRKDDAGQGSSTAAEQGAPEAAPGPQVAGTAASAPAAKQEPKPNTEAKKMAAVMREPAFKAPPAAAKPVPAKPDAEAAPRALQAAPGSMVAEPAPTAKPSRPAPALLAPENAPVPSAPAAAPTPAPKAPRPAPTVAAPETAAIAPLAAPQADEIDPAEAAYLLDSDDFLEPLAPVAANRSMKGARPAPPSKAGAASAAAPAQSSKAAAMPARSAPSSPAPEPVAAPGQAPEAAATSQPVAATRPEAAGAPAPAPAPPPRSHSVSSEYRRLIDELDELPPVVVGRAAVTRPAQAGMPEPVLLRQELPDLDDGQAKPPPEPSQLAMDFMHWVQQSLTQREMKFNEAGAMVHFVEQGMALVSPLIFKKYAQAAAADTAEAAELATRVQRELIKCGWHLPGPNKTNIVKYEIHAKGSVVGNLSCVVLVQPSRFVLPVPPSNPALKMA
ncbi:MobH family relaxase [Delftia sp. PS-11]|uniref:MobH family relaxase n=1 Tax=Delftia sp. PS-11 TaxID=2767222 RepID=UPI002454A055|nr:MobH family relaxase [Delftia sp. PS-11]KAJ8744124.1 TraI domain-containing protein [Delftia sp. PS-11]